MVWLLVLAACSSSHGGGATVDSGGRDDDAPATGDDAAATRDAPALRDAALPGDGPGPDAAAPPACTSWTLSSLAGSPGGPGNINGVGTGARFDGPWDVVPDAAGNLYVTDTVNRVIRKISPLGVVTTLAGQLGVTGMADGSGSAATFDYPAGLAMDGSGTLYVADFWAIRKVTTGGVVTTLAGNGTAGHADGSGAAASFEGALGIAYGNGQLYVADSNNNEIRAVTLGGVVTTFAGSLTSGSADGSGTAARFADPVDVAVAPSGGVLVADASNNEIREITPAGGVSTLIGGSAGFYLLSSVTSDSAGNVYTGDNSGLRVYSPSGAFTAQLGFGHYYGDGSAGVASFDGIAGMAFSASGDLYVADYDNNAVREVTPAGIVSTVAGLGILTGFADGVGSAALFWEPVGVAIGPGGTAYVTDYQNEALRAVTPAGVVTTVGSGPYLHYASADAVDGSGHVYVETEAQICEIIAGACSSYGDGAIGPMAFDGSGNMYVASTTVHFNGDWVLDVTPSDVSTVLVGPAAGIAAGFESLSAIATDSTGHVYVADGEAGTISKIAPDGTVTLLAGLAGSNGFVDGVGSAARFDGPEGIALDPAGNLYVADDGNRAIRRIAPDGAVTTVGGSPTSIGIGTGSAVSFYDPISIAAAGSAELVIVDSEAVLTLTCTP